MSLVDTPEDYPYARYIRPVLALLRRRRGAVPEPVKLWARMPLAFFGFQLMLKHLERKSSPLDPKLRALVRTRIALLNHCHFCVDLNTSQAMDRGVSEDQLRELAQFRQSPGFSEAETVALDYAEAIPGTAIEIDPELPTQLRKCFSGDAIVALQIPAEGFCLAGHQISALD